MAGLAKRTGSRLVRWFKEFKKGTGRRINGTSTIILGWI